MEKKNTAGRKTLTEAKLRKLARLEAGFDELLRDGADIPDYMPPRRKLAAAPEDLLAALDNAAPMPFEELETKWVSPLLCGFGVFFHLFLHVLRDPLLRYRIVQHYKRIRRQRI